MRQRSKKRNSLKKMPVFSKKVWYYVGLFFVLLLIIQWQLFFQKYSKLVPQSGGIYTEEVVGTFKNTNPLSEKSTNFDKLLQKLVYSGLVEFSLATEQYEPALATFRISEDSLTYTITIKDSAKFSNGDRVTADDVLFTFQEVIQHPRFSNKLLRDRFQYVEVIKKDSQVVEFKLPEANASFLKSLTTPILKKSKYKGATLEEILEADYSSNRNPIGSGPFVLKNIVLGGNDSSRVFLQPKYLFFTNQRRI